MQVTLTGIMICICLINLKVVRLKQREVQELKNDLTVITANNDYFLKENNRLKHEVSGLEHSVNNAAELVEQLNEMIEKYEDKYQSLFEKWNKSMGKKDKATMLISQLRKELKEDQKKRTKVESQYSYMKGMYEPIVKRNRSLELIIDSYRKSVS